MPLEPFDEIFEDRVNDLTSRGAVPPPKLFAAFGLPPGEYHLRELYCTDPACDCQFVQVHFIHESCFDLTAKSQRALMRAYGWSRAGGRRRAPIAGLANYCWRRRKQQAYVRLGQERGHWLNLPPVTPDLLGPRTPRRVLFRIWLEVLLKQNPALKDHFRECYRMVKSRARSGIVGVN